MLADEESGRGLMLVEKLSSDWGAYRKATGKSGLGKNRSGKRLVGVIA